MVDAYGVGLVAGMQPRDEAVALKAVTNLCIVASVVTSLTAFTSLTHLDILTTASTVCSCLITSFVCLSVRRLTHLRAWAWAAIPLLTTLVITGLNLLTHDTSAGGQVFFCLPVLYAGAQLRRPAALAVIGLAIVCDATTDFLLQPFKPAFLDASHMVAALAAVGVMLLYIAERHDTLVARLHRQASRDALTGLVTRRVLDEAAVSSIEAGRTDDARRGTALLLLDVDQFKGINDRFGHPTGDAVLTQLARLLTTRSRDEDVLGRLGGDELALLLPDCTLAAAEERGHAIVAEVASYRFARIDKRRATGDHDSFDVPVTVSVGVAHAPAHGDSLADLYSAADGALYAAKNAGRNRARTAGAVLPPVTSTAGS